MLNEKSERYRHVRKLGEGGMGEVWLATDTVLNRLVAVKYMRLTSEVLYKDLFVNETQILASLNHPNITSIYDAVLDSTNNQFYFVMEYVEGRSLADVLAEKGALPLEISLEISLKLLNALKYAHIRNVIHRDLKPDNIIIAEDVKLTDFGLASFESRLITDNKYVTGTIGYMSPEQSNGQLTDERTDLFSFGIVLFNLLTGGKMPFKDGEPWTSPPTPLRQVAPDAPVALERLILRLLDQNPEKRFASADEVINALGALRGQFKFKQAQRLGLLEADPKPLVGRMKELNQILALWNEIKTTGQPRLLVLSGDTGVGKKRLVAEFVKDVVEHGSTVLGARCDELRSPYLPFVEIFEAIFIQGLVPIPDSERAQSLLRQMPGLAPLLQIPFPTDKRDPQASQWECFEAANFIFNQLGPTLIYLEEASYLDNASTALLRYLLRHGKFPGLIIMSIRVSGQTLVQTGSFTGDDYEELRLEPLSPQALGEYLNNLLGGSVSMRVVEAVRQHSAGNLLYAEEIVRHWLQTQSLQRSTQDEWTFVSPEIASVIPAPLVNILRRQVLENLSEPQRQALAVAAMLGEEFEFSTWLDVLGGAAQMTLAVETLDRAVSLPILREISRERYLFYPEGMSQILTATLNAPRQRLLHLQIAEYFSQHNGDLLSIAHHYVEAGTTTTAARALEQAGARAVDANVTQQAISLYVRALELDASRTAYEALGRLYREQGQFIKAKQSFQNAVVLARKAGDLEAEAHALNGLAFTLWFYDVYVEAYQIAASVLKLQNISAENIANAESHLGMVAWLVGQLSQAEQHCLRAAKLLKSIRDPSNIGSVYSRLGLVYFSLGRLAESEAMFNRSLVARRATKDLWGEGFLIINQGRIALARGDFKRAGSLLAEASRIFERIESQHGLMVARTHQGQALIREGQASKALSMLEEAVKLAQKIGKLSGYGISEIYIYKAQALLALKDFSQAQAAVEEALKIVTAAGNQEYVAQGQLTLGQVLAAQGNTLAAEDFFQKAQTLSKQIGYTPGWIYTQIHYAQLLSARGEKERAVQMEQEARLEAKRLGFYLPD